jgi:hypothetical protein
LKIFPPEDRESIKELTLLPHNKNQKQLAMLLTSEMRSSTIRKWKLKNKDDPYFNEKLLVLESASVPFTSQWQHVLPNKGLKQTMTNREFHTTCKIQLLIPTMKGGTCVECGKIADPMGYHNVTCTGTCKMRTMKDTKLLYVRMMMLRCLQDYIQLLMLQ